MAKQYVVRDSYGEGECFNHYGDALQYAKEIVTEENPVRIFSLHLSLSETTTGSIKIKTHV
jgi:hypothetical protein